MAFSPVLNKKQQQGVSGLRKFLFGLCLIAACVLIVMLVNFRHTAARALTGELISGGLQGGVISKTDSSWSVIFDHFGSVTYFFPLLIVYFGYLLFMRRVEFKEIDFFRVAIRLFGFNLLVIGLCALFSGLFSSGNMGAGGILGDFLNIFFFGRLPSAVASLIPILLTLTGLFFFTAKSPLWYCDRIGALISRLWDKDRSKAGYELKTESEVQEKEPLFEEMKVDDSENRMPEESRNFDLGATEPSLNIFGDSGLKDLSGDSPESSSYVDSFEAHKEEYGKAPRIFNGNSHHSSPRDNFFDRSEPVFGGIPNDNLSIPPKDLEAKEAPKKDRNLYVSPGEPLSARDNDYSDDYYSAGVDEEGESEDGAPSSIISDSRAQAAAVETSDDENVNSTIITKYEGVRQAIGYGTSGPKSLYQKEDEEDTTSTIITKYDGKNVSVQNHADEPIIEPERVSTVITRGNNMTQMPFGENVAVRSSAEDNGSSIAGSYDSSLNEEGVSPFAPNFAGHDSDEDENVISFDQVAEEYDKDDPSIESAFVPSLEDDNILKPASKPLVSEKDMDYSSYTRGISSQESGSAAKAPQSQTNSTGREQFKTEQTDNDPKKHDWQFDPRKEEVRTLSTEEAVSEHATSNMPSFVEPTPAEIPSELLIKPESAPLTKFPTRDSINSMITAPSHIYDAWRPSIDLLTPSADPALVNEDEIMQMQERIDTFMRNFNIEAKVARHASGPVITRYDLSLKLGVKSASLRAYIQDLSRILMVRKIRMLESVPGSPYVGLEVPNAKRKMITLRDVVEQDPFRNTPKRLPLCLGVNSVGQPVVADLAKAPHLLIAGTTGSGKSAGINSILLSLLLKCSPSEMRLILIDPKRIEFSLYNNLPHLITPVISEVDQTTAALSWSVDEMERRYKLIEALGVRQLSEYNAKIRSANEQGQQVYDPMWTADMGGDPPVLKTLPYIVIVVDEFADLMSVAGSGRGKKSDKNPENLIARITAKARAAGIHLILATQTPRADVVTGKIKANMPSRIAYTVQSSLDSRIILDEAGAEDLLGNGDMLARFMDLQNYSIFRAHGPFASNDDVKRIVNAWQTYGGEPEYVDGVTDVEDEEDDIPDMDAPNGPRAHDTLFDDCASYARQYKETKGKDVSISALQVQFNIGYTRAKRIMNNLQREGIVQE
ncbi:MAG TPA: hypothetical protein DCR21_01950 [Succinivibrionaceae bacterium]|nr:hypothetical protein [Succinivibrionaceae bacterium]